MIGSGPLATPRIVRSALPRRILVDSSVWIALLRDTESAPVQRLQQFATRDAILVGDLIAAKVLQGARDEAEATAIGRRFRAFAPVELVGQAVAIEAPRNYRSLRARGVTIRRTIDLLIGAWCILHRVPLLHDDRDFLPMQDHLGLLIA